VVVTFSAGGFVTIVLRMEEIERNKMIFVELGSSCGIGGEGRGIPKRLCVGGLRELVMVEGAERE